MADDLFAKFSEYEQASSVFHLKFHLPNDWNFMISFQIQLMWTISSNMVG